MTVYTIKLATLYKECNWHLIFLVAVCSFYNFSKISHKNVMKVLFNVLYYFLP